MTISPASIDSDEAFGTSRVVSDPASIELVEYATITVTLEEEVI